MKKILLLMIVFIGMSAFGYDKLPVKITPSSTVSTVFDEIEVGDIVQFKTVNDVYKNDNVLIPAGTVILGTVDYLSENGWCFDNAQIEFKKFEIIFDDGKKLKFQSELTIDGLDMLKYYYPKWKRFFQYIGTIFRGKEIDISTNPEIIFNLWYWVK